MPIQFIPNEDKGVLGSVGEFLTLMNRNQLVQLQSKQLDLEEQKFGVEKATQNLIQQRAQMDLEDKKSVDEYISSMADDHVDNTMPGAPDGYRLLAKGQIKNYATAMAKEHIDQTRAQTQGMILENQSRGMQLEQLKASQPFYGLNAANASAMGTIQRQSAEENLTMQRSLADSQVVASKGAAAAAWKGAPLSLRQKMAQENPQIAKYLDTTTLSDDDMMSHIMTEAPDQAPIFFAMKTLGPHGFVPIMNPDGTMTTPAEVLASKLGPLFKDLNQKYGSSKGKGPTTQPSEDKKTSRMKEVVDVGTTVAQKNEDQRLLNQYTGFFKQYDREMVQSISGGHPGAPSYINPKITSQDWSIPPAHFQGKGHKDYSAVELRNIFKATSPPDAPPAQAAKVNFLLDKMIQADDPKLVYQAYITNGGGLSPQQFDLITKLSKAYDWGLEKK